MSNQDHSPIICEKLRMRVSSTLKGCSTVTDIEGGRAPSGQALAVPATPADAVDGPSGFDPSRITGEKQIGCELLKLTHWSGDITDPHVRADLYKDVRRAIRPMIKNVLLDHHKRPMAEAIAEDAARDAAGAVIDLLWKGYCL